jgi:hypothetical protein
MADLLLYPCRICGTFKKAPRPVCHVCWKKGYTLNSKFCKRCGAETSNRQRTLCEDCREKNRYKAGLKFVGRNKISGPESTSEMELAAIPMKGDLYAQTAAIISEEEISAKREKFLALLAADVHIGSCGRPTRWRPPEAEYGSFGVLANRHMTGGEAGTGSDRVHTWSGNEKRIDREAKRD